MVDEDSQQSSSLSLPLDTSAGDPVDTPLLPSLTLSDSETLDEGFETQSNVSETVEPSSRSCPLETNLCDENKEVKSLPTDEALADELTRRLNFTSTRRLSHDSHTNNLLHKRTSFSHGRSLGSLKTSASAYSYPTFISIGQLNQPGTGFPKRTPSAESIRSASKNHHNASNIIRTTRHIQRCAVSRRISTEKKNDENSKTASANSKAPNSTAETDEVSSSSTITTTISTANITQRRAMPAKTKTKLRSSHPLSISISRSNSPLNSSKAVPRLGHASSCQNISVPTGNSSSKSSLSGKVVRPSGTFLLNTSQILRSSFTRPSERPLRALPMNMTMNSESINSHRSSPRSRRLLSSSSDVESNSISSPRNLRKPPSSWHHGKSLVNRSNLAATILPTPNGFTGNRKTSASSTDLRKTSSISTTTFHRSTTSKRP